MKKKKNIQYFFSGEKLTFYIGIIRKFQGIGFMFSCDNAVALHETIQIEIQFLWFKTWLTIKGKEVK